MRTALLAVMLWAGAAQAAEYPPKDCKCRERVGYGDVVQKVSKDVYMMDYYWPTELNHRPHLGFVRLKRTKPTKTGQRLTFCMLQKNDKIALEIDGFDRTVVLNVEDTRSCGK